MNNDDQRFTFIGRIQSHKDALDKKNLSHEDALKKLVMKNVEIEVKNGLIGAIQGYANQLEANIETLNDFVSTLKTEYENANNRSKEIDIAFSNYIKLQEKVRVIQEKHHKHLGRMEQKKSFASEGGKTRAANDKASKALQEVEVEIRKEINQFKRYGYGADFAKKMWAKHQDIKDIGSITKLITKIKKELLSS